GLAAAATAQAEEVVRVYNCRRQEVIDRVRQAALNDGRQAYWVCTLNEETEKLECQAAEHTSEELRAAQTERIIGLSNGSINRSIKQQVMDSFKRGELKLLVATTVIEVGVDVPNASLM
ncbi:helicase-related protein, partial [Shewanella algae]|uniref:helicase-related protein n=1 Tax=Shewanella algae TaxID=38313 RepID=UPI003C3CDF77